MPAPAAFVSGEVQKYNITEEYIVGGTNGTFTLIDLDGTEYIPGTDSYNNLYNGSASLWQGQHNVEYFGGGLLMMFDNGYAVDNDDEDNSIQVGYSRLLAVRIDAEAKTARIEWEHALGYNSSEFGDADRLPSGNILGCGWPTDGILTDGSLATFDAEVFEVTEDHEDAWVMRINGNYMARYNFSLHHASRDHGRPMGWTIYSAERFYKAPLVTAVSCSSDGVLSFTAFQSFKVAYPYAGGYRVVKADGSVVVDTTSFDFSAFHRETYVEDFVGSSECASSEHQCVLEVYNRLGERALKDFTCG